LLTLAPLQSLRGFDARLIFVDEAAFVAARMYTAGILPVAQQRYTCTILTTTPGDDQSYIMQQAKKVDLNGDPLMPCLLLGDPCADCKAKNEYAAQSLCRPESRACMQPQTPEETLAIHLLSLDSATDAPSLPGTSALTTRRRRRGRAILTATVSASSTRTT
jgi:hypothetical protein